MNTKKRSKLNLINQNEDYQAKVFFTKYFSTTFTAKFCFKIKKINCQFLKRNEKTLKNQSKSMAVRF